MIPLRKRVGIWIVVGVVCLGLLSFTAQATPLLGQLPFSGRNLDAIANDLGDRLQPQVEQALQTAFDETVQPTFDQFNRQLDTYRDTLDQYQAEITALPTDLEVSVRTTVDGIAGQVEDEIDALSTSIEETVTGSIRRVGWGILVGELLGSGAISAIVTWLIVRRVNRQLNAQIGTLKDTIADMKAAAETAALDIGDLGGSHQD